MVGNIWQELSVLFCRKKERRVRGMDNYIVTICTVISTIVAVLGYMKNNK